MIGSKKIFIFSLSVLLSGSVSACDYSDSKRENTAKKSEERITGLKSCVIELEGYICKPVEVYNKGKKSGLWKDGELVGFKRNESEYWIQKVRGSHQYWVIDNKGEPIPNRNSDDITEHIEEIKKIYDLLKKCESLLEKKCNQEF